MSSANLCSHCSCEIPESQPICPECYSSTGGPAKSKVSAARVRKNVMIFFRDPVHSQWFQDRVIKYVPEYVEWTFYVESPEAFREITRGSAGSWGLLIVDPAVAEENLELFKSFVDQNPKIVVAIQYDFGTKFPVRALLRNAIMFQRPSDIDPWLLVMHQLLDMVEGN